VAILGTETTAVPVKVEHDFVALDQSGSSANVTCVQVNSALMLFGICMRDVLAWKDPSIVAFAFLENTTA
jgi:hypothetical protein